MSTALVILAIPLAFYPLLIHIFMPYLTLYHHFKWTSEAKRPSHIWVAIILLTWSFGSYLYTFLNVEKRSHKIHAGIGLVHVLLIALLLPLAVKLFYAPILQAQIEEQKVLISQSQNTDRLKTQDFQKLYLDLDQLAESISTTKLWELEKMQIFADLLNLMKMYLEDKRITAQENHRWRAIFDSRDQIDETKFKDYIANSRQGREPASLPMK